MCECEHVCLCDAVMDQLPRLGLFHTYSERDEQTAAADARPKSKTGRDKSAGALCKTTQTRREQTAEEGEGRANEKDRKSVQTGAVKINLSFPWQHPCKHGAAQQTNKTKGSFSANRQIIPVVVRSLAATITKHYLLLLIVSTIPVLFGGVPIEEGDRLP